LLVKTWRCSLTSMSRSIISELKRSNGPSARSFQEELEVEGRNNLPADDGHIYIITDQNKHNRFNISVVQRSGVDALGSVVGSMRIRGYAGYTFPQRLSGIQ
jgi:hypothetical protein